MSLKGKKVIVYNDLLGRKFDSIKEAQQWIMTIDPSIKAYWFKCKFSAYINGLSDDTDFYGFVCKYYTQKRQ